MKAKLLVDSATDISKAEAESLGIGFLPNVFGKANGLAKFQPIKWVVQ